MNDNQFAPIVETDFGNVIGYRRRDACGGEYFSYFDIAYGYVVDRFDNSLDPPDEFTLPVPPRPRHPKEYSRDDCSYIHIHTPTVDRNANLPVFIFIPNLPHLSPIPPSTFYGPDFLVAEGLVVAVITYRTGLLVDVAFEDESLGVTGDGSAQDIYEALHFFKLHVKNFGGDNNNITACGQGFGAAFLRLVMLRESRDATCENFKLFHKAIFQSSLAHHVPPTKKKVSGRILADKLGFAVDGVSDTVLCHRLRSVPLDVLLEYETDFYQEDVFHRIISSNVVSQYLEYDELRWKYPIIIGFNSCEGILEKVFNPSLNCNNFNYDLLLRRLHHLWNDKVAQGVKNFFSSNNFENLNDFSLFTLLSDLEFNIGILWLTSILTYMMSPSPVYLYKFDVDGNRNISKRTHKIDFPGACHGDELGYIFQLPSSPPITPNSLEDKTVTRMIKYWTNFAKFHDPNPLCLDQCFNKRWENVALVYSDLEKRYERPCFVALSCLTIGPILHFGLSQEVSRMYI